VGHNRLGNLPRTKKWKEVVALVGGAGSSAAVADATLDAAYDEFAAGAVDPTLVHSVYLLANLPDAAKSEDVPSALSKLGLNVVGPLTAASIAAALGEAVDAHVRAEGAPRSDLGEMARLSAMETLSRTLDDGGPGLFGADPHAATIALGQMGTEKNFGAFTRDFFGRLTERVLTFYVSKELPLHTGPGHRFETLAQQRAFQESVALHARQAAKIVEAFGGSWLSKVRFEKDLTPERTERFVAYAMKKMRDELRRGAA
jgi:hypothetical protein